MNSRSFRVVEPKCSSASSEVKVSGAFFASQPLEIAQNREIMSEASPAAHSRVARKHSIRQSNEWAPLASRQAPRKKR